MVAAQQANQNAELTVYGVVTNGKLWEFAKIKSNLFTKNEDYIDIADLCHFSSIKTLFGKVSLKIILLAL